MSHPIRTRAALRQLILVMAASLLAASAAHATKYAGEFLKQPVGARALGMGGHSPRSPTMPPRRGGTRPG
jgi:hypothetical protein